MNNSRFYFLLFVGVCLATSVQLRGGESPAVPFAGWHGPVSVAASDTQVLVAEQDSHTLAILDGRSGAVQNRVSLPGPVNGVCLNSAGLALAACGVLDGSMCLVDVNKAQVVATIPLGHTPVSPVVDAAGRTAWVCLRFENALVAIDLAERRVISRIDVGREPIACALTPDGKTVVVAHHLPEQAATDALVAAKITFVDIASGKVVTTVSLPNGSTSVRGLCLSPDGVFAYVSHVLGHFQYPTTQVERGWMNNNVMSIINVASRTLINTVVLDTVTEGSANPWGATCTSNGAWLTVACAGTHELIVIDRLALHQRLDQALEVTTLGRHTGKASTSVAAVKTDMEYLKGISRHIALPGNGPRGVASVGTTVWVPLYFSDGVASVVLSPESAILQTVDLGPKPIETPARIGERLFNDATQCLQHWQSCETCHPDGRADGLNWDLRNDGIGNPKNTRSLVLAPQTARMMSLGVRDSAAAAIRAGFRYILFHPVSEADADAVQAYLQALTPLPSPHPGASPAAMRGKTVFATAGCAQCHSGPLYTDLAMYDVGTGPDPITGTSKFTNPSLAELWRTAPYLHDGRAPNLRYMFDRWRNPDDKHGATAKLSEADLTALVEYLLSL